MYFRAVRVLPELRVHFHHHVILIQRRVHRRDLALAEGVVERIVDRLRRDPESRRGGAIDDQRGLQPVILLVAVDVDAVRAACCSLCEHARRPDRADRRALSPCSVY